MRKGPRPKLDETQYAPRTLPEQRLLIAALVDSGTRPAQARTIATVLTDLPEHYSRSFSVTMSRYRDHLARIGAPPWESPSESSSRSSDRDLVAA